MSSPQSKTERPPLKLTLQADEGEQTIHLTYGLFSDLQRVCPNPGSVIEAGLSDPYARDYIIRRCLTESKKMITEEADLIAAENVKVNDPDEIEKLLTWVTDHLLHFFARSAAGLKGLSEKFQNQMPTAPVVPSKSGSED